MRIKVYIDEDVPLSFVVALLNRGVDVVTTQGAGNSGISDKEQLLYAVKEGRVIFTHNKRDFRLLHNEYLQTGEKHSGIVLSDQLPVSILLRRFMNLWFSLKAVDMQNRLEFLSNWK